MVQEITRLSHTVSLLVCATSIFCLVDDSAPGDSVKKREEGVSRFFF